MNKCNICGGPVTEMEVIEQMLGMKEKFSYLKCTNCGHTHLSKPPDNPGKYYDSSQYYSFNSKNSFTAESLKTPSLKTRLKHLLLNLGAKKNIFFSAALKALLEIKGVNKQQKILDFGCGSGHFVQELTTLGFTDARGYDPFLPENVLIDDEVYLSNDLALLKTKSWDVITLNHVFEHLENPVSVLKELHDLLRVGGKLLLRFPVIDSFAFEKYRENWVQFDAPRHANLFTRKSIRLAVQSAGGFSIEKLYDDSFHFQFTGSELYLKKLSLAPVDNSRMKRLLSLNSYKYHFLAKKLNKQHKGDQIVIILEKLKST